MGSGADIVRQQLKQGKCLTTLRVVTGSMAPLIPVGTAISVNPLPRGGVRALKTFDIVLTEMEDKLYCHYLAYVQDYPEADGSYGCVTRGLNNDHEDNPIRETAVLGVVVSHRLTLRHKLRIVGQIIRSKLASRIRLGRETRLPPSDP